jgi:sarcosine oxidase
VLGLETFAPGHDKGSSHGYHRMIRRSSGANNPAYSPLADRAMQLWRELELDCDHPLLTITGELRLVDTRLHPNHDGNVERMVAQGHWEVLDETSLAERFPGFRLDDGIVATYEADAGFLRSEAGIMAHLERARTHGAVIQTREEVTGWAVDGSGVTVSTRQNGYTADRLVITTGPWAGELLAELSLPLHPVRVINAYFQPERPDLWTVENGAPNFSLSVVEGGFYGVPALRDEGWGSRSDPTATSRIRSPAPGTCDGRSTTRRSSRSGPCWTGTCPARPGRSFGESPASRPIRRTTTSSSARTRDTTRS